MVTAQLKELLGKTKSIIIVNGKILTHKGFVVFGRKPNKHVKYYYADNHQQEHELDDAEDMIEELLSKFDSEYSYLYKESGIDLSLIRAIGCDYTHAVSLNSTTYTLLQNECMRSDVEYTPEIDLKLLDFLYDEVVNSFDIFDRVLKLYLSRGRFPSIVKGHLAGRFYQPYIFDTNAIKSALNYTRFNNLKSMFDRDGVKLLDMHGGSGVRANMFVVPTDSYCNALHMKIYPDIDVKYFTYVVHMCMITQICMEVYSYDNDRNLFLSRLQEFSKLNKRIEDVITSDSFIREWYESFLSGYTQYLQGVR